MSGELNGTDFAKLESVMGSTAEMRTCKEAVNHGRPRGFGVGLAESEMAERR